MLNSPIDEIKNRLDIIDVIGSYIKLNKAGANYRAVCPFHSEKKPSFFISPSRQIWHCFGCGAGHSIFDFVMKIENIEFGDALRLLAQKAGVELKPGGRETVEWRTEKTRLFEICELATRFFQKQLAGSKKGQEVKNYLTGRGINEDSIKKWKIGWSPDAWQGLFDFLVKNGYGPEEIERVGLAIRKEGGGYYDRFRNRIIFPVFDLNSQVIGFGGRIFEQKKDSEREEIAKYINSPATPLYDKSRVLYGLNLAKMAVRQKDACVLVEGYTDVIMAHQSGFENVAATSGTALTVPQLKILKRYSENLFTAFDMDPAGDSATKRGIDLAQSLGFNIKVLFFPEEKDPADLIAKDPKEWEKIIESAKSILDFYFDTTFSRVDSKTPEGKKAVSKILLPVIKRIPNQIEKSFWTQQLAKKLEIKEEDVLEEMKKVKISEEVYGLEPEEILNQPQKSRKELLEERLIILIMRSPQNIQALLPTDTAFFSLPNSQVIAFLRENAPPYQLKPEVEPPSTTLINYLLLKSEIEEEVIDSQEEFGECLKEFRCLELKNRLDQISQGLKKAEDEKNQQKIEELINEFNDCSKLLCDLDK